MRRDSARLFALETIDLRVVLAHFGGGGFQPPLEWGGRRPLEAPATLAAAEGRNRITSEDETFFRETFIRYANDVWAHGTSAGGELFRRSARTPMF